ncbi:MAG TPA: GntR family transcriptional regulator [Clostridiales bacterium]|nr:GntR family transcriptional regulator [Clostridiales bacterium]
MFQLDLKSRKSIYEQIVDNCKELIVAGVLAPNDRLPSVRELSATLTVNPNTIQKAYRELEQTGWIYTVSGLGCFVSESRHEPDLAQIRALLNKIGTLVQELLFLGVSLEEVKQELDKVIQERGASH